MIEKPTYTYKTKFQHFSVVSLNVFLPFTVRSTWLIAPELTGFVDYTWHFPVRNIPDYFSYHQQSGVLVIFAARHIPDYSGVM